jgi:hypothetical protein
MATAGAGQAARIYRQGQRQRQKREPGPLPNYQRLACRDNATQFTAKTAAQALKGLGPFTALSALALPGQRQEFSAKAAAAIIAEAEQVTYGRRQWQRSAWTNDDDDLLDIIAQLAATGILDN